MQNGETVFVAFVSGDHLKSYVTKSTVIDAEHRIVRRDNGDVRILADFETAHATEAQAWAQAAREVSAYAENMRLHAERCASKAAEIAAASSIVQVPA